MIKVSVVIPVYNVEKYIENCLDSVLNQTLTEIQVICVDDGSTDRSLEILKAYEKKDQRVEILTQENRYAGVARNYGMEKATGKYIIFLDSDDFFEPEMLEELYNQAEKTEANICVCNGRTYNDQTGEVTDVSHYLVKKQLPENNPFNPEEIEDYLFQFTVPAPWNKLYRRDFLESHTLKFQEIKRTNDMYFTYMSFVCAEKIAIVDKRLLNYRTNVTTSLQGSNASGTYEFIDALAALKKELMKKGVWKKYEKTFVNRALSTCLFNLNKVTEESAYIELYNKLINESFYQLNVLSHIKKYFYNAKHYEQLAAMARKSAEESWSEKQCNESKKDELLDIENWIRPVLKNDDEKIKVSVVIPIYNVEEYIEECVKSVVNQTLKEIEVLCINDGTKDHSIERIQEYIDSDDRVRLINKENGGLSQTRNVGIHEAQGEYILFLDSDDYLDNKALEIAYYEAKKQNLDQLYYSASMFYDDCISVLRDNYYDRSNVYYEARSGQKLFCDMIERAEFKPSACLVISRRTFLLENNLQFKEGLIHEDNLFTVQAMYFSKRSAYINANLYMRRVRQDSIMTDGQNFKHAYFHYIIIRELKKFAIEQQIDVSGEFFDALMKQIERLQAAGGRYIVQMNEEELKHELDKLSDEDFFNFNLYIVSVGRQKENYRTTLERARGNGQSVAVFRQRARVLKNTVAKKNLEIKNLKNKIETQSKAEKPQKTVKQKVETKKADKIEKKQTIDMNEWKADVKLPAQDHPYISVIIPVYNVEKYLAECIESILNQTLGNIEVICVNDGSTDQSGKILKEYAKKDERITILEKENGGASSARNLAIPIAKGDYIAFIDADDYLEEKALEYLYIHSIKENLDMIMYSAEIFYDDCEDVMKKNYYERDFEYNQILTGQEMFAEMIKNREFKTSPCLYLTKRKVITDNHLTFVECIHEDNSFTPQVMYFANRVRYVDVKPYHRRIRSESTMTEKKYFKHALHYYYVAKDIEKFIANQKIEKESPFGEALCWHLDNNIGGAIRYLKKMSDEDILKETKQLEASDRFGFERYVLYRMESEKKIKIRNGRIDDLNKKLEEKESLEKKRENKVRKKMSSAYHRFKK